MTAALLCEQRYPVIMLSKIKAAWRTVKDCDRPMSVVLRDTSLVQRCRLARILRKILLALPSTRLLPSSSVGSQLEAASS